MNPLSHLTSGAFWWGVGMTLVALWIWRSYGSRLGRLPGGA